MVMKTEPNYIPSFQMINFVSLLLLGKLCRRSLCYHETLFHYPIEVYLYYYTKFVVVILHVCLDGYCQKYEWELYIRNDNYYDNKIQLLYDCTQQKVNFVSGPAFV